MWHLNSVLALAGLFSARCIVSSTNINKIPLYPTLSAFIQQQTSNKQINQTHPRTLPVFEESKFLIKECQTFFFTFQKWQQKFTCFKLLVEFFPAVAPHLWLGFVVSCFVVENHANPNPPVTYWFQSFLSYHGLVQDLGRITHRIIGFTSPV